MKCRTSLALRAAAFRLMTWALFFVAFAPSPVQAQARNTYYLALGPAFTSRTDWGDGHRVGTVAEFGILHPLGKSWDVVGNFAFERFQVGEPPYRPFVNDATDDASAASRGGYGWGPVKGGNDYVISFRGGVRRIFVASARLKPYLGALIGFSGSHQDRATAAVAPSIEVTDTRTIQDNNDQFSPVFSGIVGLKTLVGNGFSVFVESGYTYVYTPDDSFDDNPAFFPLRVGVIF